jgi:hypothetical protein
MIRPPGFLNRAIFALLIAGLIVTPLARGEELKKRQSTVKGMVVRELDSGKLTGLAIGIVATAGKKMKDGKVIIRGTIGDQMKSALDEAERYVRVDHADLGKVEIAISFEERYHPKDGGSAGTAFALLLRSLCEGYEIDPKVAVTGDIAVNGKVRPIGGVTAKLRGAISDGCTIAVVPIENVPAVGDLMVRNDQMMEILKGIQVFSASTVDDAVAVVRADRAQKLQQAIDLYAELQKDLAKSGASAFRSPAGQQKLATIVDLAPNHVTAKYALDIAKGKGPKTLTRSGSLTEIFAAAWPFWSVVAAPENKGKTLDRSMLPADVMKGVKTDLNAMRRITHPDVEKLRGALVTWIETVDTVLSSRRQTISESDAKVIEQRRDALVKELKRLDTDETLLAKMMREGY